MFPVYCTGGPRGCLGGIVGMCWVCRFKKANTLMNERIWFVFITTILIILRVSVDICNCVRVCFLPVKI